MAATLRADRDSGSLADTQRLLDAAHELAGAGGLTDVTRVVRHAARALAGAEGATFVVREGDSVHYLDEEAIAPLWKGCRFPVQACISGWAMLNRQAVAIEDVTADPRIPQDLYRPTFVRSLLMVPVGTPEPVAGIGVYWAHQHRATPREQALLEALAGFAAGALRNAALAGELAGAVAARDRLLSVAAHELRTPLTPLTLQAELLRRGLDERRSAEDLKETAARLQANVARASRLVEELLQADRLAHLRGGAAEVVDVAVLAREVARQAEGGPAPVRLLADRPAQAAADPRRLSLALESLVALLARLGDGRAVEVRVEAAGGAVQVGVALAPGADGAPEAGRGEAPPRHGGGVELGIWAVRQLAEALGGGLQVDQAGPWPAFALRLPGA